MANVQLGNQGRGCDDDDDEDCCEDVAGLLKFSGLATFDLDTAPVIRYLADVGGDTNGASEPSNYPLPGKYAFQDLAVNLVGFSMPSDVSGLLVVELLKNGIAVPGFSVTYGPLEGGIKTVRARASFKRGDTFDLRVTTSGTVGSVGPAIVSATIGTGGRS